MNPNPIKVSFLSSKEESKRDVSIENISNYSNTSAMTTLLPPINRNWENLSSSSANGSGDGSVKGGASRNIMKN